MNNNHNFLFRTFGPKYIFKFLIFVSASLILAFAPIIYYQKSIELNVPRVCEEWLKNILSISTIFIIINYLNYKITINRSTDKIILLFNNLKTVGDYIFSDLNNGNYDKVKLINLSNALERLLNKILNEDEFLYRSNSIVALMSHSEYFKKLKNYIETSEKISTYLPELKNEFENIIKILSSNIYNYTAK